jgi:hypothetical protein
VEPVGIKLVLGVDTGPANEELDKLKRKHERPEGAGPGPGVSGRSYTASPTELPEGPTERVHAYLRKHNIEVGHYLRNKEKIKLLEKDIDVLLGQQADKLQKMQRDPKLTQERLALSRELTALAGMKEAFGPLVQSQMQRERVAKEQAGIAAQEEGAGAGAWTRGMGAGQLVKGGLLWRGAAALGAAAVANPVTALVVGVPAALVAAAKFFEHVTDEVAEYGESIGLAFRNVERRTGTPELRGRFETPGGMTHERFLKMGYAGEHLSKMVEAYGMPGKAEAVAASVYAQGRFARAYGFGEQPGYIAGLGRRATQLGVGEPGAGQEHYWNMMAAAVEKGTQHGVDATEKMRALVGLTEQVATHTGIVSQRQFAGLAGMMAALEGPAGGSRFFKGERGTQYAAQIMEGIANPKEIAQQRLVQTLIGREFGGHVPTAKEAGITDRDEAVQYDRMTEIQKLQYIQGSLHGNPKLLGRLAKGLEGAAGNTPYGSSLLFEGTTGIDAAKQPAAYKALAEAARKQGMKQSEIEKLGMFGLYGAVMEKASPREAADIFKGIVPKDTTTQVEQARAQSKANMEAFSTQVGQATLDMRLSVKNIESAVLEYTGKHFSGPGTGRNKIGGAILDLPVVGEGIGKAAKGVYKGFDRGVKSIGQSTRVPLDWRDVPVPKQIEPVKPWREGETKGKVEDPEKQAPSSLLERIRAIKVPKQIEPVKLDPLKLEVVGTITVTGDAVREGTVQVPAQQLLDTLKWQLAEQVEEQMRARGQRPNYIQRGAP